MRKVILGLTSLLMLGPLATPASAHTTHVHTRQHCADGSHYVHMHRGRSGGRPDYYAGCSSARRGHRHPARPSRSAPRGDDPLDRLAMCESGGNPRAHNPSGRYHGAFQFSLPTWRGLAEMSGDPHNYPYAVQKDAARRVGTRYGWQHWPTCSRKAGLR